MAKYDVVEDNGANDNLQSRQQKNERPRRIGVIAGVTALVLVIIVVIVLCATLIPSGEPEVKYKEQESSTSPPLVLKYTGFKVLPKHELFINTSDPSSYEAYTNFLDELIPPYENAKLEGNLINCRERDPTGNETCFMKDSWLFPCKRMDGWGYRDLRPCVVLTYEDDPTFIPTTYQTEEEIFDVGISDKFKGNIEEEIEENEEFDNQLVRIYCTGLENSNYHPEQGFLAPFFINTNMPGYLKPIVAIRFDLTNTNEIETECTLWPKSPNRLEVMTTTIRITRN